jgi:hypothetical protein
MAVGAIAEPPPRPAHFSGRITVDSESLPVGLSVTAEVNGTHIESTTIVTSPEGSAYVLNVPGDVPETPEIEGGIEGDVVYVSSNHAMILNHDGSVFASSRVIVPFSALERATFWGGAPTVADLTGDGVPEIVVAGDTQVVAFRSSLSVLWRRSIDDQAAITSTSAFDFDGSPPQVTGKLDRTCRAVYGPCGRDPGVVQAD